MVGAQRYLLIIPLVFVCSLTSVAQAQGLDAGGDAATVDAFVPTCGDVLGRACSPTATECGDGGVCLLVSETFGVCTCYCTVDDPLTPQDEDDCLGAASICGKVQLSSGWTENFCFQTCQPKYGANDCNSDFACSPRSVFLSGHYDQAVCVLPGCTSDMHCPATTDTSCDTTQTGQCGPDGTCAAVVDGSTAGVCVKPGKCDLISGLCDKHPTKKPAAKVGDPCRSDFDCGEYMDCQREVDYEAHGLKDHGEACLAEEDCCGSCSYSGTCQGSCSVHARNGYCTLGGCSVATATDYSEHACPAGTTCHRLYSGGVCFKTCDPTDPADCRGHSGDFFGDYECRSWNRIQFEAGVGYADSPVCEFGDIINCSVSLDCSALGPESNPANMTCRRLDGSPALSPDDPAGFCLDDTASGPLVPVPPDAGYADSAPPDSAVVDSSTDTVSDVGVAADGGADTAPDEGIADASKHDAQEGDSAVVVRRDDDGGCSCEVGRDRVGELWWLLLVGACLLRRRRR